MFEKMPKAQRHEIIKRLVIEHEVRSVAQLRLLLAIEGPFVHDNTLRKDIIELQLFKVLGRYTYGYEAVTQPGMANLLLPGQR